MIGKGNTVEGIRLSVRSLVEFILRSGDIDNRRGGAMEKDAMQVGSRMHRKIQGRMGGDYRAEVPLKYEADCGSYTITIEGRADGIFTEKEEVVIDEIKGVYRNLERMEEPDQVHLAQAKCYAYIYGSQMELKRIQVQMTYVNLESEEIRHFRESYQVEELESWFLHLIQEYRKWSDYQLQWKNIRQESIHGCAFPYPYREGQRELAAAVYRTIQRRKKLFIQAPTGVGKTLSTLYPAIQAVGQELGDRIFYLTAKTITRTVAQEAFQILQEKGLQCKAITLTAKEKICLCEETECNPERCRYAQGHYDRVNDAVYELLCDSELLNITREVLRDHARKWMVCPFEMSLDVSLWVDAVICDYNYVFDPRAKLKRFFAEGNKGDYIFLIDEAHNLVERGREMFSASLYKEDFLEVKRFLKPYSKKAERALESCNRYLLGLKRECEEYALLSNIDTFIFSLLNVSAALEQLLEDKESVMNRPMADPEAELQKKNVLDFYFQVTAFLAIYEELDDSYEIYCQMEDGKFKLRLFCIHTARKLEECLEKGKSAIFFSATLLPVRYYMELLSQTTEDYAVYAKSTFDPMRKKVLLGLDVSSRYTRRGWKEYMRIARYILKMMEEKEGNYLIFFPSYKMLSDVAECFEEIRPDNIEVLQQSSYMKEEEREVFLKAFAVGRERSLAGFCVMGGVFGEGIDLKEERLIGACIVGTGLPQVCTEREILKNYYDRRGEDGFAYAYRYPGMNKVMQSAGRVIRTETDRGIILLLDERFAQYQYKQTFPREWEGYEHCNLGNVSAKIKEFWDRWEKL